jgi:predicted metal-binding protein
MAMRRAPLAPRTHFFVCQNRRPKDSSLGPGCGEAGEKVFSILKHEVAAARAYADVWITQTACLGVCPAHGATVSIYGADTEQRIVTEVEPHDAVALYASAMEGSDGEHGLDRMLTEMEELQRTKVVALARRLKPGLTAEDIRNPHDFPELTDPDWHYEDGVLTGIQSVISAVRAARRQ